MPGAAQEPYRVDRRPLPGRPPARPAAPAVSAVDLRLTGRTALVTRGQSGHRTGHRPGDGRGRGVGDALLTLGGGPGRHVGRVGGPGRDRDWFAANAGDPAQAEACVAATVERFGGLDILVNNAATSPHFGPLIEIDRARAEKTVAVNQLGVLAWSQAAWRGAMADSGGSIVNVASIGGLVPEHGIGWYNVTKAAVLHLTRQLALELAPRVRVNALAPGLVRTQFARALWSPTRSGQRPTSRCSASGSPTTSPRRPLPRLRRRLVDHRADAGGRRGQHVAQRVARLAPLPRAPPPSLSAAPAGRSVKVRRRTLPDPVRGRASHSTSSLGAAHGASPDVTTARSSRARRPDRVRGHDPGDHALAPLGVGPFPHRHLGHPGVGARTCSTAAGQTFSPPVTTTSAMRPSTAGGRRAEPAGVTGREPAPPPVGTGDRRVVRRGSTAAASARERGSGRPPRRRGPRCRWPPSAPGSGTRRRPGPSRSRSCRR